MGGPMTVEVVVKWNSLSTPAVLFSCGDGPNDILSLTAVEDTVGTHDVKPTLLQWTVTRETSATVLVNSAAMQESLWYHILVTVADTTVRFYVNGELWNSDDFQQEPAVTTRSTCYLGGSLDAEVSALKIYSGAMEGDAVAAAYGALFPLLEFDWDFKGSQIQVVTDSVGGKEAMLKFGTKSDMTATGIKLDGWYSFIAVDLDTVDLGGAMTIEMTAKWAQLGAAALFECEHQLLSDSVTLGTTTGALVWTVERDSVSESAVSSSVTIQVGVRYHIVVTVVGNEMVSYVNGVVADPHKVDVSTTLMPNIAKRTCLIGKSLDLAGNVNFFSGEVSSLKIYSGAMTAAQVQATYATAGLVLEFDWDFCESGRVSSSDSVTVYDTASGATALLQTGRTATGATFTGLPTSYAKLTIDTIIGGPITIEFVFKVSALATTNDFTALFDCGNGVGSDSIILGITTASRLQWTVLVSSTTGAETKQQVEDDSAGNAIVVGVRYHVVATVSKGEMAIFMNGDEVVLSSFADGVGAKAAQRLQCNIGRGSDPMKKTSLSGEVSSFKLYSGAMTQMDVEAAYEANFPFLELYWDFRDATSTTIADSIRGIVAVHMSSGPATERTATGIVLDGTATHINLPLNSLMYGGAVTIEMTAKFAALNQDSRLVDCAHSDLALRLDSDVFSLSNAGSTGRIAWTVQQGSSAHKQVLSAASSAVVVRNAWSHLVATVVGSTMTTYLNGVKNGEDVNGSTPNAVMRTCTVGALSSGLSQHFNGEVAGLHLYSGAMTQLQVTAAYKKASRAQLFLQHWWDFRPAASVTSCAAVSWETHHLCCPTGMVPYGDQSTCMIPGEDASECALYGSPLLKRCAKLHPVVDSLGGVPAYLTQTGGVDPSFTVKNRTEQRHKLGALPTAAGVWFDGANDFIDVLLSDETMVCFYLPLHFKRILLTI